MSRFSIHPEIGLASTLPAGFYREEGIFREAAEKIFARSWLYVADQTVVQRPGDVYPLTLLEGVLEEPVVLTRDEEGRAHCLSNVCTHRAKIVVEKPGHTRQLSCRYHGRCFHLNGRFKRMPAFEGVSDFPSASDHLHSLHLKEWLGMFFVSIHPEYSFEEAIRPILERLDWLPLDSLMFEESGTRDYHIHAHWALYCDNYLEGFHIPFVHPSLNQAIGFDSYTYELFPYANLQTGIANEGEPHFQIPEGHPDAGKKVYAYYFWVFPNLMFNFYPWGLSLNVVEPLSHNRTKVSFRTYRFRDIPFNRTVNNLEATEMEDEEVVESVQKGVQSRFYEKGRFSPGMEPGVHHFHRLIAACMGRP